MEVVRCSGMLGCSWTVWHYKQGDCTLRNYCCENLKFSNILSVSDIIYLLVSDTLYCIQDSILLILYFTVTGINLHLITPIVCVVCIFYTTLVSWIMGLNCTDIGRSQTVAYFHCFGKLKPLIMAKKEHKVFFDMVEVIEIHMLMRDHFLINVAEHQLLHCLK
jgi:hypothetical protein